MSADVPNDGKALTVTVDGATFARIPIRTRVVLPGDQLDPFITEYAGPVVRDGDILFVTEKIVAITQGRSYTLDEIQPCALAHQVHVGATDQSLGHALTAPIRARATGCPRR